MSQPTEPARDETRNAVQPETPPPSPFLRRVLRRESTSPRSVAVVVLAIVVTVLCGYALLEALVHLVGQPSWLIEPQYAVEGLAKLPDSLSPILLGALGAVIFMVGLFFFLGAVLPGRRPRHVLNGWTASMRATESGIPTDRIGVVVDDGVLAASLARRARTAANVQREQVMVVVSRKLVVVNVRPTSGVPVDRELISGAVEEEVRRMQLEPEPAVRIVVAESGVVGA